MTFHSHIQAINGHNVHILRSSPLAELSGALGDLGTLLPLMIAMTVKGSINLGSTLVFSGLANILTGVLFGVPLPVQPMKAIAAVAISENFSKQETAAAGLTMGLAVFLLSATGLLRWLHRVVPIPVVKGIQVGAGLSLVISAGSSLIKPLDWTHPAWDNRIWAMAAFLLLIVAVLVPRFPCALVVFTFGLIITCAIAAPGEGTSHGWGAGLWHPSPFMPDRKAWKIGAIDAAIPQLPLTTLNSVLAVTSLCANLFPMFPPTPSTTAVGFSVAIANLIGPWFGAMPICHGSGGLAGQYRFGARSGSSIIILGIVKLVMGLFLGEAVMPLLQRFPKSLLGIMVLAAGVELAKVGQSVGESDDLWEQARESNDGNQHRYTKAERVKKEEEVRHRWLVMLMTVAGCLAFKNDAVGFIAGLTWHWGTQVPEILAQLRHGRKSVSLEHQNHEQHEDLVDVNQNAPEGRVT